MLIEKPLDRSRMGDPRPTGADRAQEHGELVARRHRKAVEAVGDEIDISARRPDLDGEASRVGVADSVWNVRDAGEVGEPDHDRQGRSRKDRFPAQGASRPGGSEAALEQNAFGMNGTRVVLAECGMQRIDQVLRRLSCGSRLGRAVLRSGHRGGQDRKQDRSDRAPRS